MLATRSEMLPVTITKATLLGTGIENSAMLWEQQPLLVPGALAKQDEILLNTIKAHDGRVFSTPGNALYATFDDPNQALLAAYESQVALKKVDWGDLGLDFQVNMAIHYGEVAVQNNNHTGPAVQRLKRIQAVGNAG